MLSRTFAVSACALVAAAVVLTGSVRAQTPAPATGDITVRAGLLVSMDGEPIADGAITVKAGRIIAVGRDAAAASAAESRSFPGAVIFPGLIDASSLAGVRRDRDETTKPFMPALRIVDGLDAAQAAPARSLAAGITTMHLTPGDREPVGGLTAVVKSQAGGGVRVLKNEAFLKVSLLQDDYAGDRAPTSIFGTVDALRRPDPALSGVMKAARAGTRALMLATRADRETDLATVVGREVERHAILVTDVTAGRFAAVINSSVAGVVITPVMPGRRPFELAGAKALADTTLPLAFCTRTPMAPPSALLLSAVVATQNGMSESRAERALSIDAATMLGVADRVGSLKVGKDGDFIVMSARPTDPRARLLLVVVDGIVAWSAPKE